MIFFNGALIRTLGMGACLTRVTVTVRNVQARCCCQQDSLQAYIGWLLSYLSSVDVPFAVRLALAH